MRITSLQQLHGNKLMDNHNYEWDDPESGRGPRVPRRGDDTFYELRAEPMSLTSQPEEEGDNTFRNLLYHITGLGCYSRNPDSAQIEQGDGRRRG